MGDDGYFVAVLTIAVDDVLPFAEVIILLACHDDAGLNAMLKIIYKKIVSVHFVISVRGKLELTRANASLHLL